MSSNPWVQSPDRSAELELATPVSRAFRRAAPLADLRPQATSVTAPRVGLPRRTSVPRGTVALWWVGTHGGAGESTLEQLLEGSRATGHAWPQTGDGAVELPNVILVARTSARGLRSAQLAATEWASGTAAVQLHGLVLVADMPGRLPRPLRDLAHVVAGGVPRVWRLPWVEQWRLGEPISAETAPRAVTAVLDDLRALNFTVPTT